MNNSNLKDTQSANSVTNCKDEANKDPEEADLLLYSSTNAEKEAVNTEKTQIPNIPPNCNINLQNPNSIQQSNMIDNFNSPFRTDTNPQIFQLSNFSNERRPGQIIKK